MTKKKEELKFDNQEAFKGDFDGYNYDLKKSSASTYQIRVTDENGFIKAAGDVPANDIESAYKISRGMAGLE